MFRSMAKTMKMDNVHHSDSEYDSDFDVEYDSDYMSEYDSDMSDGERYERYSANRAQFVSWWKKNNKPFKQVFKPTPSPIPVTVAPVVSKPTVCVKSKFSWGVYPKKVEVAKLEEIVVDQKKNDIDLEWTTVKYNKDKKVKNEHVNIKPAKPTRFCESFITGVECRHSKYGRKCNFAHSVRDLGNRKCRFGRECSLVSASSDISVYRNIHPRKICGGMHENETDETFYTRTTGIEKRATEEEMDEAYLVYLAEFDKPEATSVSAKGKSNVFDNKSRQVKKEIWPSSFDNLKTIELSQLAFIARINNIPSHEIKKHKKSVKGRKVNDTSVPRTANMLFLDLIPIIKKRYNSNIKDVQEFEKMIKDQQNHVKNVLAQKKNTKEEDVKTRQIKEKNTLSIDIKRLVRVIENNEKTIERLSNIKENREFYKKKIENISSSIKSDNDKLKAMEKQLEDFQDLKKFEEYINSKNVVVEPKVVESKKVEKVVKVDVPKATVTIIFFPNKKVVESKEIEIKVEETEAGWKTVCNKKEKKHVTAIVAPVKKQKKLCDSIVKGIPCRHGDNCRFSHVSPVVEEIVSKPQVSSTLVNSVQVSKAVVAPSVNKHMINNNKTKMCDSVSKGISCRHGLKCRFAHSEKELVRRKCRYGDKCYNIKTCEFSH